MSLHIGRLSPDVQHRYLEHLFQRFGCCTVNLKDGYGFAVYDSKDDAARAMRAMQGKYVCGERITVNWSKQQPRFSQGFRRSSRFVESSHERTFRDGGNNISFKDSLAQKNQPANRDLSHNPDAVPTPEKESDKFAEGVEDARDNIGEDPGDMKRDEGGTTKTDANAIEHDRWAETGKETPGGDGDDFDRYEPYHGYDRQEKTENMIKASSYVSPDHRRSSEKWQDHSDKLVDISHDKSRSPTCYTCGVAGHIARNCPQWIDGKFKASRDELNFRDKWELRQRRFGPPSTMRPEFHVDPMDQTHHRAKDGRKPFFERNMRVPRLNNVPRESRRHAHAHCSENMPQSTKETRKRSRSERSLGSSLFSEPSRYSHKDNIRGSRSNRTSSHSISRSPRSRSRFRACSPSYSAHSSSKSSQPTQCEGSRSNMNHPVPFSLSASPQHKSSSAVENKNLDGLMNSPLEGNLDCTRSEVKHMDGSEHEGKGSALNSEVPITSFNLNTVSNGESLVPDKDVIVAGYTGFNLDKNLVDDYDDNVDNGVQSQNANFEDTSSVKSNQDVLAKNGRSKSLKLTTTEVISALKHYGMKAQDVDLSDQPVEKYFGAARLWPWEIINYRRLKKGPISTENYAKRLEQNKEYGIVDQYVRSSSGWWECH
ncbi:uncharacterized protein LOC133919042 [Phragmites australis]|uniref:uncharacterized protein LOC133919042 n=1 Tax=Phragmites australis TaxID=29695 RepID=UPI002D76D1C2|nr:uncharacterized protein LOC133919042 [Phragmites australis]XP_062219236.1 uncharacterized protein LOC133919042 [Phragmites australis]XP_062219237.1 uncharacterized protein LOC133919042 [Phragmites australis]XP_062219238.1 uncharacterized protein LOC133919042 [Phragmites australis]XP_062219239.1 uncharacterized protein LOC133919042 [Phragmites australis]XP_062219242.1 uncharacterized protein LOC133919042 [Phragmites australis]XP_062219243.1 uncharacterized protein LOC133919042 [Phragmites a